mmetsp:Transcript_17662/g.26463  ORF Transcript_17662/g.26463 Transcript_17662/m.26463 type:complete len:634 (-) Transcript_17662:115-2016(-)|eukprot:CAMPEP_0167747420 /NCGR_PEP_ID=MMETSP0110_2-20121227/4275_1 /TAXON_ID=629695 /ORGANISM="Gymnochlora sp., Strain CCMP2014" /LENGTH=633 /DNA_ID=CAMNT_0007632327 /DNA_START=60 /DNA_END=1961 /DNA_ORIENTATION=-
MADSGTRYGTADISQPAIAVHWAIAATYGVLGAIAIIYTQVGLSRLSKITSPALIGTVGEVTFMMIAGFLQPAFLLIDRAANASPPCFLNMMWGQTITALLITIFTRRILLFTREAARINVTKFYLRYGIRKKSREIIAGTIPKKEIQTFHASKMALTMLGKKRVFAGCTALFLISSLLVWIDPINASYLRGESQSCRIRTIGIVLLLFYIWAIPYLYFVTRYQFSDPYHIVWKLKVQLSFATVLVLCFILVISQEPNIGSTHFGLTAYMLWMTLVYTYWYTESYVPYKETVAKANFTGEVEVKLVEVIVSPEILIKFEDHLIEEWSIENLEFYRKSLIYRVKVSEALGNIARKSKIFRAASETKSEDTLNSRKSIASVGDVTSHIDSVFDRLARNGLKIYYAHISLESRNQVNIKSRNREAVADFFLDDDHFENLRQVMSMNSSFTSATESRGSNFSSFAGQGGHKPGSPRKTLLKRNARRHETHDDSKDIKLSKISVTSANESPLGTLKLNDDDKKGMNTSEIDSKSGNDTDTEGQQISPKLRGNKRQIRIHQFCRNLLRAAKLEMEDKSEELLSRMSSIVDIEAHTKLSLIIKMRNIFDDAQKEVFELMSRDSFRRFVNKPEIIELLQRI